MTSRFLEVRLFAAIAIALANDFPFTWNTPRE